MKKFKNFLEENRGPCWKGYVQVGTKMKNGREVPNCVPEGKTVSEHTKCGTPDCCGKCDAAILEGSESWESGYKRRVVKTTDPEHKEKGMNWRIKGKDRPEISIKLYKEKPSQAEFNKQMKRVAGHEFGG